MVDSDVCCITEQDMLAECADAGADAGAVSGSYVKEILQCW
jgi:hypothetical protein